MEEGDHFLRIFIILDSKTCIPLTIYSQDQIIDIKNQIYNIKGITPAQQQLSYCSMMLENNKYVKEYSIKNDSALILKILNKQIQVYVCVNLEFDNYKPISIDPDQSISELKNEIYRIFEIDPICQKLFFCHQLLEDAYSLNDYSIQKGSQINVQRQILGG